MGWQPALADPRDYTPERRNVQDLVDLRAIGRSTPARCADLREYFPPVEDQGTLNSACAFAVLGLIEYYEARCHGPWLTASRMFLHATSLRLRGTVDDIGTDLRTTLKALRRFGAPPERYCRYETGRFAQPWNDPFLFGFANDYQDLAYIRLDAERGTGAGRLKRLKACLTAGLPFVLGFPVPTTVTSEGLIGGPCSTLVLGGQAAVAVGFDDAFRIGTSKGALLIRNSWGAGWGEDGYGWLAYDALLEATVTEAWTVLRPSWIAAMSNW